MKTRHDSVTAASAGLRVTSRAVKGATVICLGPQRLGCPDHWMDEGPDAVRLGDAHATTNPGHAVKAFYMRERISVADPVPPADPAPPARSEPRYPEPGIMSARPELSAAEMDELRDKFLASAASTSTPPRWEPAPRPGVFPLNRPGPAAQPVPGAGTRTTDRPGNGRPRATDARGPVRYPLSPQAGATSEGRATHPRNRKRRRGAYLATVITCCAVMAAGVWLLFLGVTR